MSIRKHRLPALLAAALLAARALGAAPLADEFDARIAAGLALLYQGQYDAALDSFRSFDADHPANPAGRFFSAGALQLRGLAYESDSWDRAFLADLDSALALSERVIARDPADPWAFFFRGGAYAYLASREARRGRMLAALNKGLSGVSDLKRAVQLDPGLYDAYLGLGSYHYFRTKAASIFKWLPFIGDRRDQGIAELRLAAERGRYTGVMARHALTWVLVDYGKLDLALDEARGLEREFPANHAFHWAGADIHYRRGQWAAAAESYRRLAGLNQESRPMNNHNRVFIAARLARCLHRMGSFAEAAAAAREAISLPLTEDAAKRLRQERVMAEQVLRRVRPTAGMGP